MEHLHRMGSRIHVGVGHPDGSALRLHHLGSTSFVIVIGLFGRTEQHHQLPTSIRLSEDYLDVQCGLGH
jgi:hypothetical protein